MRYDCTNCDMTGMTEDEAYAHSREYHHCTIDQHKGEEAFCHRWDH